MASNSPNKDKARNRRVRSMAGRTKATSEGLVSDMKT